MRNNDKEFILLISAALAAQSEALSEHDSSWLTQLPQGLLGRISENLSVRDIRNLKCASRFFYQEPFIHEIYLAKLSQQIIAASEIHSYFICDSGKKLYITVDNDAHYKQVHFNENYVIEKISTFCNCALVLFTNGKVYVHGYDPSHGVTGLRDVDINRQHRENVGQLIPFPLLESKNVINISQGLNHSMCITKDNELLAWGNNSWGQIGREACNNDIGPMVITLPNNEIPKEIFACTSHSLCLSKDGHVYSWGCGTDGRLGTGNENSTHIPTRVGFPGNVNIKQIAAYESHVLCIAEDGNLYAWGLNDYGQVGKEDEQRVYHTPTKIDLPNHERALRVYSGHCFSLCMTESGNAYAWGVNLCGQLGTGNHKNYYLPTKINLPNNMKVCELAAGKAHSLCYTDSGQLFAWGSNHRGVTPIAEASPTPFELKDFPGKGNFNMSFKK